MLSSITPGLPKMQPHKNIVTYCGPHFARWVKYNVRAEKPGNGAKSEQSHIFIYFGRANISFLLVHTNVFALKDYVSVIQTFTKYTRPYKWNELDMVISGDEGPRSLEGMRLPRISFVIIPDSFKDAGEEKEYTSKFQRLVEYFCKIQSKGSKKINIEMRTGKGTRPQTSSADERFIVDLRKKRDDKNEWMELIHDSTCDTQR